MVLSDLGADVIRVERPTAADPALARPRRFDTMLRNRRSIVVDLQTDAGVEVALRLVDSADVVIEGYRPGTMERPGLGPERCMARNPGVRYWRGRGWGSQGRR